MFVGFQAAGTRGRVLCDGAKQIKLLGQVVNVNAKIERLDSMSAHADAGEILRWLKGFTAPPQMTFIVHGEPAAARSARPEDPGRAEVADAHREIPRAGRH